MLNDHSPQAAHRSYAMGLHETVKFLYPIWYGEKGRRGFEETYRQLFNK